MILYDEFGQLLGADAKGLKLFGCSNIAEFKEKVSDISDFFVNKEGYIHKFDHYDWIDFLNYSEEKIDKVLIKQEKNRAIEAKVVINEIENIIKINGSNITYLIEFTDQKMVEFKDDIKEDTKDDIKEQEKELLQTLPKESIKLSYNEMEKEYDVSKELYQELLNDFIVESKDDLELMEAYILKSNYESLLKIVNKLKNICINLKLNPFIPILNAIERNVRNKGYNNIEKFLNLYKEELQILAKSIREL